MTDTKKGIYLAFFTAVISGVSIFINKFAVDAIKQPLLFTTVKNVGVALIIFMVLLLSKKLPLLKKLNKREVLYLLAIGIIGGSIPFYLFFTGLSKISALNGALIHKTLVIWVAILAAPLLKERLTKLQGLAVLILFASNLVIGGFKGFSYSSGELFVLCATLLWAVENILAKKVLPTVDSDILTLARMGVGSAVLLILSIFIQPQALANSLNLNTTQWFWLSLTIITLFGYVWSWYKALKYAPATTVAAVLVSATLVTNILSAIFVTHSWNSSLTIQGIMIVSGVYLYIKVGVNRSLITAVTG